MAVVNRELARRLFGSVASAVGRQFQMPDGARIQVVGVVEDGKYRTLTEEPQATMFFPLPQAPSADTFLVVRSNRDPQQLAAAMRGTLRRLDAGLPFHIQTWSSALEFARLPSSVATVALGVLGAIGVMLSITGIFGMAAHSVSSRLKELGIRIAIGAKRGEVLQAALGRAAIVLASGSAAGLVLGVLASRLLSSIVHLATSRDPVVWAGVGVTMLLLGLVATWLPAQRAVAVDPARLLQEE